jgi:hypothetical protein
MRLNRTHKIVIAVAAVVLVIVLIASIASCSPKKTVASGTWQGGYSATATTSCVPPLACGPSYAGYIPPYYLSHPSYTLLTPYSSLYRPVYNGRTYTAARTPAGRAPVATRKPLPYPPGYKPVPGDFQPPTAKAPAPAKPSVKAPAPAKKAEAPKPAPKQISKVPADRSGR